MPLPPDPLRSPPDGGPPATPEMLDPDPPPRAAGPRWERWIGLALVLGLAGFGLFTWWTDSTQQSAYRAGLRAEGNHDWDAALAAFRQAGDYQDAKTRAGNAATFVQRRDSAYSTATPAYARQDWAALAPAVAQLQSVAPFYRDTPRFIEALETEVYTPALSGTVALRTGASPAGWYTYRPGGWRYLDGSDTQSRIHARCPDGSWVLDVPGPPGPAITPTSDAIRDRHLAVVGGDGKARAQLNSLPLAAIGDYVCDGVRVWNLRPATGLPRVGNDIYPVFAYRAAYQAIGQGGLHTPVFPDGNWYVLDIIPGGDLLVIYVGLVPDTDQIQLYRTAPDGSNARRLGDFGGAPSLHFVNPDGHFASLMLQGTVSPAPSGSNVDPPRQTTIVLLDLTGAQPPQTMADAEYQAQYDPAAPELFGYFLSQPPYRGRLLVSMAMDATQQIRLYDPAQVAAPQTFPPMPRLYGTYQVQIASGGGLLLGGLTTPDDFTAPNTSQPISATLLYLPPQGDPQVVAVPSARDHVVVPFDIRAGQLIYFDTSTGSNYSDPTGVALYHLPVRDLGTSAAPTLLYSYNLPLESRAQLVIPFWPGAQWLAYITPNGDLHTRRYDGSADVLLDHGYGGFLPWTFTDGATP